MKALIVFGEALFDELGSVARGSPRRRRNFDFHSSFAHPAHRFLNAMEPDSYSRPHRHLAPEKDETFVVVRGAFGLLLFDADGRVKTRTVLRAGGANVGANVPAGEFHCLVSLEQGSVFFEAKAGPYDPVSDKDWAPWAPPEGDPDAPAFLVRLKEQFA